MTNGISHCYQLDPSISNYGLLGSDFHFFFSNSKRNFANSGEPDQALRFAASDLFFYCLPMSHKKER